jgi:murein L,D-transpeptidase YcbB/YkuD
VKRESPCVPTGASFKLKSKLKRLAASTSDPKAKKKQKQKPAVDCEDSISAYAYSDVTWSGTLDPKKHVGLCYMVRMMAFLGVRRRSNSLFAKAFAMAAKIGLSMDELLYLNPNDDPNDDHQKHERDRMHVMTLLLSKPVASQQSLLPRVFADGLPRSFQQILHRPNAKPMQERWVWARRDVDGQCGMFLSEAFERDLCSYDTMTSNWNAKISIHSAWTPVSCRILVLFTFHYCHYCFNYCFTAVSIVSTIVSLLFHCCFTAVSLLFHCCFTAGSLLFHADHCYLHSFGRRAEIIWRPSWPRE